MAQLPNKIGGSFSSKSANADTVVAKIPPMRASMEPDPTPAFLEVRGRRIHMTSNVLSYLTPVGYSSAV